MVLAEAGLANHNRGKDQLELCLMIGGGEVGERGVELIKQVPIEVGSFLGQPRHPDARRLICIAISLQRPSVKELFYMPVERAPRGLSEDRSHGARDRLTMEQEQAIDRMQPRTGTLHACA